MAAQPLFTPVSFIRGDVEEIRYAGGSLVIYGQNGVGKSLLLEAIASCLQGEILGRAVTGYLIPEDEALLGVAARLKDGLEAEDIEVLQPPPGQYPYEQLEVLRKAIEVTRSRDLAAIEDSETRAIVGSVLDQFASLRHVFLAPLPDDLGPGWRLHAAAVTSPEMRGGLEAQAKSFLPVGNDDIYPIDVNQEPDPESWYLPVALYRYNGYKPHVTEMYSHQTVFDRVIDESRLDVAFLTARWLRDRLSSGWVNGAVVASETVDGLRALTGEWAVRANQLLNTLMVQPPELTLQFGDPTDWLVGRAPGWLGLESLGFAERRWAKVAIALSADTDDFPFLIVDEPERGLHRSAEAFMAEGLRRLASEGAARLLMATHSPEFIDTDLGQLIHLKRSAQGAFCPPTELSREDVEELREVGLQPTALLSTDRGYLLVEGEHDKEILEGYFADDLRALRVKVLAMRGTKNLMSVFDSEFLVNATDALLMPLLDDISMDPLVDLWVAAEMVTLEKPPSAAVTFIQREIAKIPGKGKDVYKPFLVGAINRGQTRRFFPLGMSKKDVLEYLPVDALVPEATSWKELRREWLRSPASIQDRSGTAYKKWLRTTKYADLTPENLRFVAETTGAPPPELKAIIARIAERLGPTVSRIG